MKRLDVRKSKKTYTGNENENVEENERRHKQELKRKRD